MKAITDGERATLRGHCLRDPEVCMAAAGFLAIELRANHSIDIEPRTIAAILQVYVTAVDLKLAEAEDAYASGFRVAGRREGNKVMRTPVSDPVGMARLEAGMCIDCTGDLVHGPKGGVAQNCACKLCGAEFNIAKMGGEVIMAHRNSVPGKPDRQRLFDVFGIRLPETGAA